MKASTQQISLSLLILTYASGCNYHVPDLNTSTSQGDTDETELLTPENDGIYNMACWNGDEKNWSARKDHSHYVPDYVNACAEYEKSADNWESEVRNACSNHCKNIAHWGEFNCEDDKWTKLEPAQGVWQKCAKKTDLDLELIESVLGSDAVTAVLDLPCELAFTCHGYLDIAERTGLWTEPSATVHLSADTLVATVKDGASTIALDQAGVAMAGSAAYTATSCGAGACPFYLAQFDLAQEADWSVTVAPGTSDSTPITKEVTDLKLSLKQPTLGIWLPDTGSVIFPPNSLLLRAQVTLAGKTDIYGENGSHDLLYLNSDYVFGRVTFSLGKSTLDMQAAGRDLLGQWSLAGEFETPQ